MNLKTMWKQMICNHDFTMTTGTGIYDGKKNKKPLIIHPVTKMYCPKCKKYVEYVAYVNRSNIDGK